MSIHPGNVRIPWRIHVCQMHQGRQWIALLAGLLVVLMAAGCAPHYADHHAFVHASQPVPTGDDQPLRRSDVIALHAPRVPGLHDHRTQVAADGTIALPALGERSAAGHTPAQLAREIEAVLHFFDPQAQVHVQVLGDTSRQVYVFGEVARPGPYPCPDAQTVLQLLARAQPTRLANPTQIQLLRPAPGGGEPGRLTIDLNEIVRDGTTRTNVRLASGDILYVPPTALAAVGLALRPFLAMFEPSKPHRQPSPDRQPAGTEQAGREQTLDAPASRAASTPSAPAVIWQ